MEAAKDNSAVLMPSTPYTPVDGEGARVRPVVKRALVLSGLIVSGVAAVRVSPTLASHGAAMLDATGLRLGRGEVGDAAASRPESYEEFLDYAAMSSDDLWKHMDDPSNILKVCTCTQVQDRVHITPCQLARARARAR